MSSRAFIKHEFVLVHSEDPEEAEKNHVEVIVKSTEEESKSSKSKLILGLILALASGTIFTINNGLIQNFNVNPTDNLLVRSVVQILVLGLIICYQDKGQFWPCKATLKTKFLALLQGLLGGTMILCCFIGVLYMPLGDALTIIFSVPLFTMVFSRLILGTRLNAYKILCGLCLVAGVILVARPPFLFPDKDPGTTQEVRDSKYWTGFACCLTSAVLSALMSITINIIGKEKVPIVPLVLVWYAGFGGLAMGLLGSSMSEDNQILSGEISEILPRQWGLFFGMAIIGILAFFLRTKSLHMINPTMHSFVQSLEIVLAFCLEVFVMKHTPCLESIFGASLVIVSVIFVALEESLLTKLPKPIVKCCEIHI